MRSASGRFRFAFAQKRRGGRPLTASMCQSGGVATPLQEASMGEVSTVGIDLAKSVFQVHGADTSGAVVFRKKLRRDQVLTLFSTVQRSSSRLSQRTSGQHR